VTFPFGIKKKVGKTMNSQRRSYILGLILIYFLVSAVCGSAEASKIGDDIDTANWQSYSNAESKFSFKYPKDWEVIDEGFYKTSFGLTIQRIGGSEDSDNWIRINSPQFQEEDGKCIEVDKQFICTYSKDANVLDIFKRVAASFKLK
jgi:hypothetical protein